MSDNDGSDRPQIPTTLRLLLILEQVAQAGSPVSPKVLIEATGLPKATIHRLLNTAEEQGYLQRDVDGRKFGPGHRLRAFAANTLSSRRVRTERLTIMKALSAEVGETCNLAAPGRYGMIYLDRVDTHWPLQIKLPVGTQVPFHCTASGKLYLSSLRPDRLSRLLDALELMRKTPQTITNPEELQDEVAKTRERGYSTDNQEFMEGMVAIAAPILDDRGRLLTTLSIHAPAQRHDVDSLTQNLEILQDAARQLAALV